MSRLYLAGICLVIIGIGNTGSDSILTGPVTTTLGERDGRGLGAGVTALVNGVSSIGGIVEGIYTKKNCKFILC